MKTAFDSSQLSSSSPSIAPTAKCHLNSASSQRLSFPLHNNSPTAHHRSASVSCAAAQKMNTPVKETKLWGGRFEEGVTDVVERFAESISFDKALYKHDIMGSRAHASMLAHQVFDLYGVCCKQCFSTPKLAEELNLKIGKLTTGDSLDMSPQDEASIIANGATVKDMEGAAVAYVADLLKVPTIFVKAVTDIVDGEKPTAEEFLQNLGNAVTDDYNDCVGTFEYWWNHGLISDSTYKLLQKACDTESSEHPSIDCIIEHSRSGAGKY